MKTDTIINAVRQLESRQIGRALTPREQNQLSSFLQEGFERITQNGTEISGTSYSAIGKKAGKHKIPRYLYHATTQANYNQMMNDGVLKVSQTCDGKGIFAFSLKNFAHFWNKTKDVIEQPRTSLLNLISQKGFLTDSENIVLLKIPTETLDTNLLRIRRQKLVRHGELGFRDADKMFNNPFKHSEALEGMRYLVNGESALNAPLCNQRKEAIEYIIPHNISMKNVRLVGSTRLNYKEAASANQTMQDMPQVWKNLTAGTPEREMFDRIM